uniref:hypothetical protein n=1 Tax=Amycolatopsis sp. CA-096443 TaxID=3239919 RepID=UPI003F49AF97
MPTRSLIGILSDDGRTYLSRYCHNEGRPTHQLPALGEALHHHAGDLALLVAVLLDHDWSYLAPSEAAAEAADGARRNGGLQPIAGIGYRYADNPGRAPVSGALDEGGVGGIEWLYLVSGNEVRVHYEAGGAWAHFGTYDAADLAHLDLNDLTARETEGLHP